MIYNSNGLKLAPCNYCNRKPGFFADNINYCWLHWEKEKLKLNTQLTKKIHDLIKIALKSAPPPPEYIPDNVCVELCHVCHGEWFEDTITMFCCQCKELRLCPKCAYENNEPAYMEHNMIDCNYVPESEDED